MYTTPPTTGTPANVSDSLTPTAYRRNLVLALNSWRSVWTRQGLQRHEVENCNLTNALVAVPLEQFVRHPS